MYVYGWVTRWLASLTRTRTPFDVLDIRDFLLKIPNIKEVDWCTCTGGRSPPPTRIRTPIDLLESTGDRSTPLLYRFRVYGAVHLPPAFLSSHSSGLNVVGRGGATLCLTTGGVDEVDKIGDAAIRP